MYTLVTWDDEASAANLAYQETRTWMLLEQAEHAALQAARQMCIVKRIDTSVIRRNLEHGALVFSVKDWKCAVKRLRIV
jgi:hypothetical protein